MKATRKCSFCGKSFVTRSGMQRYCSEACQAEARRARMTQKNNFFKAVRPIMEIQHQEYLTFSKAAILMGCSRQYIYKLVAMGKLKASRISNRMAFIRRADIERMLEGNPYHRILPGSISTPKRSASSSFPAKKEKREKVTDEVLDFYSGEEVMSLYKVKQSWLYTTAKRNRIPICRIAGKNYYSKKHVDEFFGTEVRTGKVMQYNPGDGHRVKDGQASAVNWIHSILKRQRVLAEEWQLSQCLFGEHLLNVYPDKVAVLVESEKSAVIGSALFPGYVWLAAGGKSQLREEKLRVLTGRTVLLFPDADAYAEWKERADGMTFCKVIVSDLIEKNATPEQKAAHIDIADWIIFQIQESRINCTADHLVEAERILQRMIEKNPALQKLIDDLGLVLVGASSIGSGDGNPP